MNKLIIADDEGKTTVVPLVRDEITIGRREGNTIRLTERNVSRQHARLVRSNGSFLVEDLDSYNGVMVNGDHVGKSRMIKDGDRITIGDYQLSLRSDRPVAGPSIGETAAEPPLYARLIMLGPPNPGQEFALEEGELVIGRTDENAIVINHRSISRSHSKVLVTEAGCRLIDLESANGVRVNGTDYTDVELNSGDLVELGTVRLRFVGPREAYQFDADATVQMDAVPEEFLAGMEPRKSLLPIIVAVAVVALVGVGVTLAIFLGGGEGGQVVAPEPVGAPPEMTAAAEPSADERLARARNLHEQERYTAALAIVDGMGLNEKARELRSQITTESAAQKLWQKACEQAEPRSLEVAHYTCKEIDPASRYHQRGCCKTAAAEFGSSRIANARELTKQNQVEKAIELAGLVAQDRAYPQATRDEAGELAERWRKRLEERNAAVAVVKPPPRHEKQPPRTVPDQPSKSSSGSGSQVNEAEAYGAARQAAINNDQSGCIRALSGAPRSERVVRLLLSCYQSAKNMQAACNLAKRYERYSHARQFAQSSCR